MSLEGLKAGDRKVLWGASPGIKSGLVDHR